MREIRTSGLMSGEGKRSDANAVQTTAPFLDSTEAILCRWIRNLLSGFECRRGGSGFEMDILAGIVGQALRVIGF